MDTNILNKHLQDRSLSDITKMINEITDILDKYDKEYNIIQKDWKKQKSFIIKNSGYDAYIVMSSHHLNQDSEFEVKEDATKSQIKTAFAKSLKTKKLNKKVLGEFISLVV